MDCTGFIYFCCFQRWICEQMGQSSKVISWHCFRATLLTSLLQAVPPKSKWMLSIALTDISRIAVSVGSPVRKYQLPLFLLSTYSLCSFFFCGLIRNWPIVFQAYVNFCFSPLHSGFSLLICELYDYPQLVIHFCNHIAISCIFRNGFFQPLLHLVPVVLVLNRNFYLSTMY